MKSIEVKAKSMESALAQGLEQMKATVADVNIDVLEEGKKGFLGIGAKPVVIRLTLKENITKKATAVNVASEKTAPSVTKKATTVTKKRAESPNTPPKSNADEKALQKTIDFLTELTQKMNVAVEIKGEIDSDNGVRINMYGDTVGILIGRRGETLDAIQYITRLAVNSELENYCRITLDSENYRAKREETLVRLANRMASRAIKTEKKVKLEAMNPYERRIIHSALQSNDKVNTHSEGDAPNRRVVIVAK